MHGALQLFVFSFVRLPIFLAFSRFHELCPKSHDFWQNFCEKHKIENCLYRWNIYNLYSQIPLTRKAECLYYRKVMFINRETSKKAHLHCILWIL